jgi:hypothetical protein
MSDILPFALLGLGVFAGTFMLAESFVAPWVSSSTHRRDDAAHERVGVIEIKKSPAD